MDGNIQSLGERVAHLQVLSGLDRAALSQLAGLAPSHVGAIIRGGVKNPAGTTLGAIARVTGASNDWLIAGCGEPPTEKEVIAAIERARASASGDSSTTPPSPSKAA